MLCECRQELWHAIGSGSASFADVSALTPPDGVLKLPANQKPSLELLDPDAMKAAGACATASSPHPLAAAVL